MSHEFQVNQFRVRMAYCDRAIAIWVLDEIGREFSGQFAHSHLMQLECAKSMDAAYKILTSPRAEFQINIETKTTTQQVLAVADSRFLRVPTQHEEVCCVVKIVINNGYSTNIIDLTCGALMYNSVPAIIQLKQANKELSAKCDDLQASLKKLESESRSRDLEIAALKKLVLTLLPQPL